MDRQQQNSVSARLLETFHLMLFLKVGLSEAEDDNNAIIAKLLNGKVKRCRTRHLSKIPKLKRWFLFLCFSTQDGTYLSASGHRDPSFR